MSAHRLSSGFARLSCLACSSRRRAGRMAVLASTLALATGTALALLPAAASAEECPNTPFRTGPSSHLPDCRAYEMVTPAYKDAGYATILGISPSGLSALLGVNGAFAGVEGYPNIIFPIPGVTYTTRRTASGWVSAPDDPPASEYLPFLHDGFTSFGGSGEEGPDGQATVWFDRGVWQPDNRIDFFMRRPDRSIVDIGPALPPTVGSGVPAAVGEGLRPVGLSDNASRYFFTLTKNYWPFDGTQDGLNSLYEYLGMGNTAPLLVGVDDSGKQIGQCGTVIGGAREIAAETNSGHNAVSEDGNTVFFTALPGHLLIPGRKPCEGSGPPVAELFARIGNGLPGAHTVAISEPSKEDCSACDTEAGVLSAGHFEGASEDGSKVFFTTTQPLLGGGTGENLYEYDFDAPAGERVVRVSAGDSTVSNPTPGLIRIPLGGSPVNSEDGSHVYFIAGGVLTKVPNIEGELAEPGANNLYVFERDERFPGGHTAFIAKLSDRDLSSPVEVEHFAPDLTPDGRFLVFLSERDLTPDDTSAGVRQVFEYDAQTGALVRVSIGQDGFDHNGNDRTPRITKYSGITNDASIVSPSAFYYKSYHPHAYSIAVSVSADGSYVFFQSTIGLTPQALDRKVVGKDPEGEPIYARNVYEYHAGRVSLISDGQDVANVGHESTVEFLGADASGRDVFFQTADALVGQDTDTNLDIYDARIDGGFPAPAVPPACSGDACQGPLSGAPTLLSPGSEFQAGGNPPLAAPTAAKPKQKSKKPKPKRRKAGKGHAKRRGQRANRAAVGGHAKRKAGRS